MASGYTIRPPSAASRPVPALRLGATALLFCTLWSSAFVAGKAGLSSSPPLFLLTLRFVAAGVLMVAAAAALGIRPAPLAAGGRAWLVALFLGALNNVLYLGMSFYALQSLPAGFVVIVVSTAPILTAVMAHAVLDERLTARKLAGLVLSMAGVWLIMHPRIGDGGAPQLLGTVLVSLSAVSLAVGTVTYKRYGAGIPALWVNAWSTVLGALILLPVAFALEDVSAIVWDLTLAGSVGYLVFVVSIGAMLLWLGLIRLAGAGRASTFHFLNPVLGVALAWLVLGEIPAWNELLGVVPVSLGVLLAVRGGR